MEPTGSGARGCSAEHSSSAPDAAVKQGGEQERSRAADVGAGSSVVAGQDETECLSWEEYRRGCLESADVMTAVQPLRASYRKGCVACCYCVACVWLIAAGMRLGKSTEYQKGGLV